MKSRKKTFVNIPGILNIYQSLLLSWSIKSFLKCHSKFIKNCIFKMQEQWKILQEKPLWNPTPITWVNRQEQADGKPRYVGSCIYFTNIEEIRR